MDFKHRTDLHQREITNPVYDENQIVNLKDKCPISLEDVQNLVFPVLAGDNHIYEMIAIIRHLNQSPISPVTRQDMTIRSLRPCISKNQKKYLSNEYFRELILMKSSIHEFDEREHALTIIFTFCNIDLQMHLISQMTVDQFTRFFCDVENDFFNMIIYRIFTHALYKNQLQFLAMYTSRTITRRPNNILNSLYPLLRIMSSKQFSMFMDTVSIQVFATISDHAFRSSKRDLRYLITYTKNVCGLKSIEPLKIIFFSKEDLMRPVIIPKMALQDLDVLMQKVLHSEDHVFIEYFKNSVNQIGNRHLQRTLEDIEIIYLCKRSLDIIEIHHVLFKKEILTLKQIRSDIVKYLSYSQLIGENWRSQTDNVNDKLYTVIYHIIDILKMFEIVASIAKSDSVNIKIDHAHNIGKFIKRLHTEIKKIQSSIKHVKEIICSEREVIQNQYSQYKIDIGPIKYGENNSRLYRILDKFFIKNSDHRVSDKEQPSTKMPLALR